MNKGKCIIPVLLFCTLMALLISGCTDSQPPQEDRIYSNESVYQAIMQSFEPDYGFSRISDLGEDSLYATYFATATLDELAYSNFRPDKPVLSPVIDAQLIIDTFGDYADTEYIDELWWYTSFVHENPSAARCIRQNQAYQEVLQLKQGTATPPQDIYHALRIHSATHDDTPIPKQEINRILQHIYDQYYETPDLNGYSYIYRVFQLMDEFQCRVDLTNGILRQRFLAYEKLIQDGMREGTLPLFTLYEYFYLADALFMPPAISSEEVAQYITQCTAFGGIGIFPQEPPNPFGSYYAVLLTKRLGIHYDASALLDFIAKHQKNSGVYVQFTILESDFHHTYYGYQIFHTLGMHYSPDLQQYFQTYPDFAKTDMGLMLKWLFHMQVRQSDVEKSLDRFIENGENSIGYTSLYFLHAFTKMYYDYDWSMDSQRQQALIAKLLQSEKFLEQNDLKKYQIVLCLKALGYETHAEAMENIAQDIRLYIENNPEPMTDLVFILHVCENDEDALTAILQDEICLRAIRDVLDDAYKGNGLFAYGKDNIITMESVNAGVKIDAFLFYNAYDMMNPT